MIREKFPDYEGKIAAGLAGHGSQCFGYDDDISKDHDYEVGFCLWIDDEIDVKIGVKLAREYRKLPVGKSAEHGALAENALGVRRISDFYRRYTGSGGAPESWQQWMYTPSYALAEATNGEVWRDDCGEFSKIRNEILTGMPEDVRVKKIAAYAVTMAQSGQYNYSRCIHHGENGAAMLALDEFVKAASGIIFLLNRRHAPYYKWVFRALRSLPILGNMADALEFLLTADNEPDGQKLKIAVIEDICASVTAQLKVQELTCGSWDYLEPHALDMMRHHIQNPQIRAMHVMEGI